MMVSCDTIQAVLDIIGLNAWDVGNINYWDLKGIIEKGLNQIKEDIIRKVEV